MKLGFIQSIILAAVWEAFGYSLNSVVIHTTPHLPCRRPSASVQLSRWLAVLSH